jgi:hypothetical protein
MTPAAHLSHPAARTAPSRAVRAAAHPAAPAAAAASSAAAAAGALPYPGNQPKGQAR